MIVIQSRRLQLGVFKMKDAQEVFGCMQNTASRRIAEHLGGEIIGSRANRKNHPVVYRISSHESTPSS